MDKRHHVWCNGNPKSPVETCHWCSGENGLLTQHPQGKKTEEELMKEHFPDNTIVKES